MTEEQIKKNIKTFVEIYKTLGEQVATSWLIKKISQEMTKNSKNTNSW